MRQTVLIALFAPTLLFADVANAQRSAANLALQSSDVESVTRNADGRIQSRLVDHYTAGGDFRGSTLFRHEYVGPRRSLTERVHRTADGVTANRTVTQWKYRADGRQDVRTTRWTDGSGALTRHETARWQYGKQRDGTLITTTVTGPGRALIETRYTILHNDRGLSSADTSVFDADGVQTARHLTETRGVRTERWTFDSDDAIVRHEIETRTNDERGRTLRIDVDIFDGRRRSLGARDTVYTYSGTSNQIQRTETTWFGADDYATRRQTTSYVYQGGVHVSSRVRWEHWQPETPAR